MEVELNWSGLDDPFMVDMPADRGVTGKHDLFSVFVDNWEASATINGRKMKGRVMPRDFAGRKSCTAFLALSETWVLV